MEKGEIAQNEQISPFPTMISMQFVYQNPLSATFQLSSAASLNLEGSQNGNVLRYMNKSNISIQTYIPVPACYESIISMSFLLWFNASSQNNF